MPLVRHLIVCLLAWTLLAYQPLFGAESSHLELSQVLDTVDRTHPTLAIRRLGISVAEAKVNQARGPFDLQARGRSYWQEFGASGGGRERNLLGAGELLWQTPFGAELVLATRARTEGNFSDDDVEFDNGIGGATDTVKKLPIGAPGDAEISAGIRIPLMKDLLIDKDRAELKGANLEVSIADLDVLNERSHLFKEASKAYWEWVSAGLSYHVALQLQQAAEERAEGIKEQVEAGNMANVAYLEALAQGKIRAADAARAKRKLEMNALDLATYLWPSDDSAPRPPLESTLPEHISLLYAIPKEIVAEHISQAQARRPEIGQIRQKRERIAVNRRLAWNDLLPQADLEVTPSQSLDRFEDGASIRASLTVGVPLLQLENRGNLEEWEVKLRQNRYDMLRESGLIVNQISDALSAMEAARRRAEYHHEALLDLQHLVQAERERLRLGASDLLTVNLREQMAAEEEIELIEAVADHRKALADYKHAIGQWSIPGFDQSWLNAIEKEFTWNPS